MPVKRLAVTFFILAGLLLVAGALEVTLFLFPQTGVASEVSEVQVPQAVPMLIAQADEQVNEVRKAAEAEEKLVQEAHVLADGGAIVFDGAPISVEGARELIDKAGSYTAGVQFIPQRDYLPSGCELIALTVALRAEGYSLTPTEIADGFLETGSNVATQYLGSPRTNGGGLPPCIVAAANKWLAGQGSGRAIDLTGTSFEGVRQLVELGYPVLTWTTEQLRSPYVSGAVVDGQQWYRPEHCVVVYGTDADGVMVSDSIDGMVKRDVSKFTEIYGACGSKAALIIP